jgi:hypothetical protein
MEGPAIPELMSLREASEHFKVNRDWLRGCVFTLGIKPIPVGCSLALTRDDLERIGRLIEERKEPETTAPP